MLDTLEAVRRTSSSNRSGAKLKLGHGHDSSHDGIPRAEVTSLLQNDLGVSLPLHISLSRPLTLRTDQRESFLTQLKNEISESSSIKAFDVQPGDLAWHSNESHTRWFLVLRLESASHSTKGRESLNSLLTRCNAVAKKFGQPTLYAESESKTETSSVVEDTGQFHISIAWSLQPPKAAKDMGMNGVEARDGIPYGLLSKLTNMVIRFGEVKVRIGQDVHRIPLKARRVTALV